ncbi:HPP family protein [Bacillus cereus]|uniref:HPP family protein n=1 Tax=Bacillus cereus TaxID=1396 RepID=A0A2A8Q147_BACCE|nr:hypothetical protein ICY_03734 [Bacillus cereus BAG2X1-3]PEW06117.1 HPP family protein [Bacillus cereus]
MGMAIAVMMLTRTTHPPAGADPIIVILGANSWSYLVTPVLVGSVVIVVIALFINNMSSKKKISNISQYIKGIEGEAQ